MISLKQKKYINLLGKNPNLTTKKNNDKNMNNFDNNNDNNNFELLEKGTFNAEANKIIVETITDNEFNTCHNNENSNNHQASKKTNKKYSLKTTVLKDLWTLDTASKSERTKQIADLKPCESHQCQS